MHNPRFFLSPVQRWAISHDDETVTQRPFIKSLAVHSSQIINLLPGSLSQCLQHRHSLDIFKGLRTQLCPCVLLSWLSGNNQGPESTYSLDKCLSLSRSLRQKFPLSLEVEDTPFLPNYATLVFLSQSQRNKHYFVKLFICSKKHKESGSPTKQEVGISPNTYLRFLSQPHLL